MSIYQRYPSGYYVYYYLRSHDSTRIRNAKKGSPYYVGKGSGRRAWVHHTHGINLPQDRSNIIIIAEGLDENTAHKIEQLHIRLWGRIDIKSGILYNRTNGGEGTSGAIKSEEARRKTSLALKGKPGRKQSAETRKLISQRNKERVLSPEAKARMLEGLNQGRGPRSEEIRNKISKSRIGMSFSEEHKQALKEAWSKNRATRATNKGKVYPLLECPWCSKLYRSNILTRHQRWHCNSKPSETS